MTKLFFFLLNECAILMLIGGSFILTIDRSNCYLKISLTV